MGHIFLFIDRSLDIDDHVSNVTSIGHQCPLLEVTAFLRLFCDQPAGHISDAAQLAEHRAAGQHADRYRRDDDRCYGDGRF